MTRANLAHLALALGLTGCPGSKGDTGTAPGTTSTGSTVATTAARAQDDLGIVDEGGTVTLSVLGNDLVTANPLAIGTVAVVSTPQHGEAVVNANGTIEYNHSGDEASSDSFTYTVDDVAGVPSNAATVRLTVVGINDPPVAVDDAYAVDQGQSLALGITGNDTDADDGLAQGSVSITSSPSHANLTVNGNGTVTYTHDGSAVASDSFSYTVADQAGAASNEATVSITVITTNAPPTANDDTIIVLEGGSTNISLVANDTDPDDGVDPGSLVLVAAPTRGNAVFNANGTVDYTHDGSEFVDSFTYRVADFAGANSNSATVQVLVTPVNDPPAAVNDAYSVDSGQAVNLPVLLNDVDVDNLIAPSTVLVTSQPSHGTAVPLADGTVDYTNDGSANPSDSFGYTVQDASGAVSNVATVSLTVNPGQPPTAVDDYAVVDEGSRVTIDLAANDLDPDSALDLASVSIVDAPLYGSLQDNGDGTVEYTHDGSETGFDTFVYTIDDVTGLTSNEATVQLPVNPVNDPPVAVADNGVVSYAGGFASIFAANNDYDADDGLDWNSIAIIDYPQHGYAFNAGYGYIDYYHYGGAGVSDSLTYVIYDNSGAPSNLATVGISIPAQTCYVSYQRFDYTGAAQTYTIPAGCTGNWAVEAYGAGGEGGNGGLSGYTFAELFIAEGQNLVIQVGGVNGYNGGGAGVGYIPRNGGGATDLRLGGSALEDRVVIAGGGGGSAGDSNFEGGNGGGGVCGPHYCGGGGAVGWNGGDGGDGDVDGGAGFVGPHAGGGGGGGWQSGGEASCSSGYGYYCADDGQRGLGGDGVLGGYYAGSCDYTGVAGGGGGLFGGGGSASGWCGAGGGGGGSSYASPNVNGFFGGANDGNGELYLFFQQPAAPTYVGGYVTSDGPDWYTTPPYTCQEACALNFGGNAATYQCSTSDRYIDNRARLNGYGTDALCDQPAAEDYKLGATYNCGGTGCAYSAWNSDGWCSETNHCWQ